MKPMLKNLTFILTLLVSSVLFVGCDKDDDNNSPSTKSITQIVIDNPDFSILEAAVVRAGLGDALASGNLTVFAPDNAAFNASGITESMISALPVSTLDSILKYHVLGAPVTAAQVPASDTVKTLLGLNIYASSNANGVFVNGIKVKTADIAASNGVIHTISKVLMPPTSTIAGIAASNPDFSLLVAAVVKAGLLDAISSAGKYTVFAPTNAAFNAAGFNSVEDINNASTELITNVVKYHVLATNVAAGDLINGATPSTLQGGTLTVGLAPAPNVKVTGSSAAVSNITGADIIATNGIIHVIDKVLLP
ncbi:fasciclin domain-containing protein [Pollutibacter soli]|uniref:fasciclin domain-containing protein n=1 Tax=Pollutibacter soli TaxID=3034157 RepID=UPI003013655B